MAKILKGVIDDGTREIPLYNNFGKLICKVYFRPADFSIVDRYNKLIKEFPDVIKPLENLSIKADGTAEFEDEWKILKEVENNLKNKINELFDMDEADEIFKTRNPFSSVGGDFFCYRVIAGLSGIITEAITEEAHESKKRMSKYLKTLKPVDIPADEVSDAAGSTADNA